MKKNIFLVFLFFLISVPAFAQKIPVKITPAQVISTNNDEVEIGDWINFETAHDTFVDGHLYIKKNTPVVGFVDFVHPNGWANDKAEICINKFKFSDVNNKQSEINSPIKIEAKLSAKPKMKDVFTYYVLGTFRGSEIYVEPDTKIYNLFIER